MASFAFVRDMVEQRSGWIEYPWINAELGETTARSKVVAFAYAPEWGWVVGAGSYVTEFMQSSNQINRLVFGVASALGLLAVLVCLILVRAIVRPIVQVVQTAQAVAGGDLRVPLLQVKTGDEVEDLAARRPVEETEAAAAVLGKLAVGEEVKVAVVVRHGLKMATKGVPVKPGGPTLFCLSSTAFRCIFRQ